ncbi:hypothetical protein ALC57_11902 [Trachymyrmex cornetzi]|uniref:Uncharacterized protein n=1 Tax=Trachymyrmex cornetzi TaxID=471704 RepID=A0A195DSP6_9HYME|nr:hypothetical protein ALC57_11902 [Trachymyrmex cornetzi]
MTIRSLVQRARNGHLVRQRQHHEYDENDARAVTILAIVYLNSHVSIKPPYLRYKKGGIVRMSYTLSFFFQCYLARCRTWLTRFIHFLLVTNKTVLFVISETSHIVIISISPLKSTFYNLDNFIYFKIESLNVSTLFNNINIST